jgi:uncharacterized membrane protein YphA (DoxX/SURF4 family)
MNPRNKWLKWVGFVLNALVAALMLFAGSGKVFGSMPPEFAEKIRSYGLDGRIHLIGAGEMIAALLLVIPWTSPLGTLLTSGFWGGAICLHMSHHEDILLPSIFLAVTWLGAYLRGSVPLLACNDCCATAAGAKEMG